MLDEAQGLRPKAEDTGPIGDGMDQLQDVNHITLRPR